MLLTLKQLRSIIKEEVERNIRWSAGFFNSILNSANDQTELSSEHPLTSQEEREEKENTYEQEKQ